MSERTIKSAEVARDVRSGRVHWVDFARGLACISMPFYHTLYNLYTAGLTQTLWTKNTFWSLYQHLGLGTFVMVSGMAFVLSTQGGIRWNRLTRRAVKLGLVALAITLATYIVLPEKFVRFGVIHFFTCTILLAPLFRPMRYWAIIPGLAIVAGGIIMTRAGLYPEPWLYITGMMSNRPSSIDYIPLIPWFGVFLVGMGCAAWIKPPKRTVQASAWMRPVIWLGKHSLPFYIIHQLVIFAVLQGIAMLLLR